MSQTDESVRIVLSAEDTASGVIAQTAQKAREADKAFGTMTRSVGSTSDGLRKLLMMTGGQELAGFIGQLKEASEAANKLKAGFGGVAAGVAGAAGAGVAIGYQIGSWAQDIERAKKSLEQAREISDDLDRKVLRNAAERGGQFADILARTAGKERQKIIDERKAAIDAEIRGIDEGIKRTEKERRRLDRSAINFITGGWRNQALIENLDETLKAERARRDEFMQQKTALQELNGEHAIELRELERKRDAEKERLELAKQRQAIERNRWRSEVESGKADNERFIQREQKRLLGLQREIDDIKNRKIATGPGGVQTQDTMLLTRNASAVDYQKQIADASKKSAELDEKNRELFQENVRILKEVADRMTRGLVPIIKIGGG